MSTTEDTSTIDEKKGEDTESSTKFKDFIYNYLSSIIFTIGIGIFFIGSLGLYTTKVAQANILPDNIELAPYTVIDRIVKDIPIDINIMRPSYLSETKDILSQKAIFNSQEYLDSFNKSFLCSLKKNAENPNGGGSNASLYFSYVFDNIVAKNFLVMNTIFLYLSYLPESLIMLLYAIFGIFLWFGLYFFNICISIFYHIINIPQLFRNPSEKFPEKWESSENIGFFNDIPKLLLFCFFWWWVGIISAILSPIFFTIYGLISPLYATYEVKQTKKTFNVINFILNTFVYKKLFFLILATLSLFSNGVTYLGSNSIIGIIIAIIFACFIGLFYNEIPEPNTDGFTLKIRQNIKQATVAAVDLNKPLKVKICPTIPIDDIKIQKILDSGTYRSLTKPKEVEGDIELIPSVNDEPLVKPGSQSIDISNADLETLQNRLNFLQSEIDNFDVGQQVESYQKDALIRDLEPEINQLQNKIAELTQIEPTVLSQSGGKKQKYKLTKNTKKYNIRLV
jgi:hypothetical protein